MRSFTDLPIKRKLTLVITLTCFIALSLASAAFIATEIVSFRRTAVRDITTLAQLIGTNASVALTFDDAKSATEILATMRARPDVVSARLYTKRNELLGSYDRAPGAAAAAPGRPEKDGYRFEH